MCCNSETMHGVSEKLAELDVMVRRMILESFGIEKYINEHLDSTNYLFRMMKYTPPPPVDDDVETKVGLPSHTDKNIMTILHQYQVEGLEIQTKDEKWFKVKPSHQYSFIVMVGDSMCVSSSHFLLMCNIFDKHTTYTICIKQSCYLIVYVTGIFEWSIGIYISPSPSDSKEDKVFDCTVLNSKNRSYPRFT